MVILLFNLILQIWITKSFSISISSLYFFLPTKIFLNGYSLLSGINENWCTNRRRCEYEALNVWRVFHSLVYIADNVVSFHWCTFSTRQCLSCRKNVCCVSEISGVWNFIKGDKNFLEYCLLFMIQLGWFRCIRTGIYRNHETEPMKETFSRRITTWYACLWIFCSLYDSNFSKKCILR